MTSPNGARTTASTWRQRAAWLALVAGVVTFVGVTVARDEAREARAEAHEEERLAAIGLMVECVDELQAEADRDGTFIFLVGDLGRGRLLECAQEKAFPDGWRCTQGGCANAPIHDPFEGKYRFSWEEAFCSAEPDCY